MASVVPPRPAELDIHKQGAAAPGAGGANRQPSGIGSAISNASNGVKVKPVTLCVFTMKKGESVQKVFPSGRFTTVSQIQEAVCKELGIQEEASAAFSIWLSSKHLQLQLKSYHLPCKLFKKWKDLLSQYTDARYDDICEDEPILSFQRNTFFPLREERKMIDPKKNNRKAIELLYNEAMFNVTKARYPFTEEDFHELAGIQAAVYSSENTSVDFTTSSSLRHFLHLFYPPHLLTAGSKKTIGKLFHKKQTEHQLFEETCQRKYESVWSRCTDVHHLKLLYLQYCWSKPFYGSMTFSGQVERSQKHLLRTSSDKRVVVALNTQCLHIYDFKSPPNIMLYLMYDQLSWEYEEAQDDGEDFYSSLWLEFDSVIDGQDGEEKVSKRVRVFSRQAPMMDAMISRCISDIEKAEEEIRQIRRQQGCSEELPECSIQTYKIGESPRVQRQGRNYREHQMRCTTFNKEGEIINERFTLSRPFKKRKPRSGSDVPPAKQEGALSQTPTSTEESHSLQTFQKQTSNRGSISSSDL